MLSSFLSLKQAEKTTQYWLHKPGGVLSSIPDDCRPFHFPLFSIFATKHLNSVYSGVRQKF